MKIFTIKSRQDFLKIQKECKNCLTGRTILLLNRKTDARHIIKNTNITEFCRFGFTVSKKISKLAVDRNRIKRVLRAVVQMIEKNNQQDLINLLDYELIVRKEILNRATEYIYSDLVKLLVELKNNLK